MQDVIAWVVAHKYEIVCVLFLISEALSFIPAIKANGVFQLIFGWLGKLKEAFQPKQA